MKTLRILLPILIAFTIGMFGAEWLAKQTQYDLGVVVVRLGGYDISTGLPQTLVLIATVVVLIWLVWASVKFPFKAWRTYKQKQDLNRLVDGLRHAELGQWQRAEQLLMTASKNSAIGAVAFVAALRCAQWHQDSQHTSNLMQQLGIIDPVLFALEQSESQLHRGQARNALDTLETIKQTLPPRGGWICAHALIQEGRAKDALDQLESIRQQGYASNAQLNALEKQIHQCVLLQADDVETLNLHWNQLSDSLQVDPTLVRHYVERSIALGAAGTTLLKTIEHALEVEIDANLALLYATLPVENGYDRLHFLDALMVNTGQNPALLTAAAIVYANDKQPEKSFDLVSQAILQGGDGSSWELLGQLYHAAGQTDNALKCLLNAIQLFHGKAIATPLSEFNNPSSNV